jgi:heme exporter protein C
MLGIVRPSNIEKICDRFFPWVVGSCFFFLCTGITVGLFFSPADYQQGETVRIMYIHVPASWWALGIYTLMALTAGAGIVTKIPTFHLMTRSLAPIGLYFTSISLVTGAIWGKPTWGTWWVWDARLTSMLILFFLYAGYQTLITSLEDYEKATLAGAVIALVGWINVPLIKWSVDWWTTLHQPASIMRFAKPAIHWTMLLPLGLMTIAFSLFIIGVFMLRFRIELIRLKEIVCAEG